jgi:hypothetical protein
MRTTTLLFAVLCALPAFGAGPLAFGIKGGMPFQDLVDAKPPYESVFKKWTFGPMIEIDLPGGVGAEAELLYRGTGYRYAEQDTKVGSWEVPVLLKYRFPAAVARPYIGAGVSFRHIGDLKQLSAPGQLLEKSQGSRGYVFEVGVRLDGKLAKLSPEIRYTRWDNSPITVGSVGSSFLKYRQNQVEFLIGLTF